MRTRLIVATVSMIALVAAGCGGPKDGDGSRPDSSQFSSEWLAVSMGGMMSVPGEGPSLTLNLRNSSRTPLWVEVEFTTPNQSSNCIVDKKLEVGGGGMFTCAQKSLVQDEDYPVLVRTFADAKKTKLLESTRTQLRFAARDVAKFEALTESMQAARNE